MMRFIFLITLLSLITSCKESQLENTDFLKTGKLQLAPPRLEMTSTIIDTSIILTAQFNMKDASIHYTMDGSDPTLKDLEYKTPLKISKAASYKFASFHEDWLVSNSAFAKAYQKGHVPQELQWETTASDTYPSKSDQSLINHQKASLNFMDVQWTGFDTTAVATVNFKEKVIIEKLTIGYLVDTKSWIFPPEKVTVFINKTDSIQVHITQVDQPTSQLADVEIPIHKTVDELKLRIDNLKYIPDWHTGKGRKAWLFMDEWIFN